MPSLRLARETASAITWQKHISAPVLYAFLRVLAFNMLGHDEALETVLYYIHMSQVCLQI